MHFYSPVSTLLTGVLERHLGTHTLSHRVVVAPAIEHLHPFATVPPNACVSREIALWMRTARGLGHPSTFRPHRGPRVPGAIFRSFVSSTARSFPAQAVAARVLQAARRSEHDVDELPDPEASARGELQDPEACLAEQEAVDAELSAQDAREQHVVAVDLGRTERRGRLELQTVRVLELIELESSTRSMRYQMPSPPQVRSFKTPSPVCPR